MNIAPKIIVVTGPTATGKTRLALHLAREFNGELISADSRQVYRNLDLGTGKDLDEYGNIAYHLIDVADPEEVYDLSRFLLDANLAIKNIQQRGKLPIICGGTALYINALLQGYELPGVAPDATLRLDLESMPLDALIAKLRADYPESFEALSIPDRVNFVRLRRAYERAARPASRTIFATAPNALVLGVLYPRSEVRQRIEERLDARLRAGMVDEIAGLLEKFGLERLEMLGLEYREIGRFAAKLCSFEDMRTLLLNRIRQFAKHQDGFFRKMEKEGVHIYWLERGNQNQAKKLVSKFLAHEELPPITFKLVDFINPNPYGKQKGSQ